MVPDRYAKSLLELIKKYYEKFPVVRTTVLEEPQYTNYICNLLMSLVSRRILNEANVNAICIHVDSVHLFRDAGFEFEKKTWVIDPVLQQMLFDAIIKRAMQLKAHAFLMGTKAKAGNDSKIWQFFGTERLASNMGDKRVLKEVFDFLRVGQKEVGQASGATVAVGAQSTPSLQFKKG